MTHLQVTQAIGEWLMVNWEGALGLSLGAVGGVLFMEWVQWPKKKK
jgi:hypothetical protein